MTCDEAEILLHALLDGELDAGNSRAVEQHLADCPRCAAQLRGYRQMQAIIAATELRETAPAGLRQRIEVAMPQPRATSRRAVLKGFAMGSVLSAAAAASVVVVALRGDDEQRIVAEIVSAHVRSLQPGHLTDVLSSEQHTVKPWFNGRLDVAPPVVDLTAQGFTLIGGRLDYVDGRAFGAIVYRRRIHVINLFVTQAPDVAQHAAKTETIHGFNVRRWREGGLAYCAVSDLGVEELNDFADRIESALRAPG
ncbi:MAG TPA: anti-sigma factor [Rhodopseudomonas sp.]|uniref:anti-sigma factor family protein n=1 Tax=Rhodopseudomonas sp. TaxID=1078 RepID=UPI002ED98041